MTRINGDYENLLAEILEHGEEKGDRTGTGTYSMFGPQLEFDLRDGFPLVTTKRVSMKSVVGELLWMLSGSTSATELRDKYGVTIWDEWADEAGDLGPIYGAQWRAWGKHSHGFAMVDQIATVVESIRNDPDSRRHVVSAWNAAEINDMALAPCHAMFQFNVSDGFLDLKLYQRSADMFLGVPFNIASYSLLLHMVAAQTGLTARRFIWTAGDAHVYKNHEHQVVEQIGRVPFPMPTLVLDAAPDIFSYTTDDIHVVGYQHHPAIHAPVAV